MNMAARTLSFALLSPGPTRKPREEQDLSCYKLSSENLTKLFPPLSAKGKHFGQLLVRACTSMSRLRAHVDLTENLFRKLGQKWPREV